MDGRWPRTWSNSAAADRHGRVRRRRTTPTDDTGVRSAPDRTGPVQRTRRSRLARAERRQGPGLALGVLRGEETACSGTSRCPPWAWHVQVATVARRPGDRDPLADQRAYTASHSERTRRHGTWRGAQAWAATYGRRQRDGGETLLLAAETWARRTVFGCSKGSDGCASGSIPPGSTCGCDRVVIHRTRWAPNRRSAPVRVGPAADRTRSSTSAVGDWTANEWTAGQPGRELVPGELAEEALWRVLRRLARVFTAHVRQPVDAVVPER